MFTYQFTTSHPPLLKDFGAVQITQLLDAQDVSQGIEIELNLSNLFSGVTFSSTAMVKITATKKWVRLGSVRKLSSDQSCQITQTLANSVEELEQLNPLLELVSNTHFKTFADGLLREVEITKRALKTWTNTKSNVIEASTTAHAVYANWSLIDIIEVAFDTSIMIVEAQGIFTEENRIKQREKATFHQSSTLERLYFLNNNKQSYETYLYYYEDFLREQATFLARAV
jgi:hypothetical protein